MSEKVCSKMNEDEKRRFLVREVEEYIEPLMGDIEKEYVEHNRERMEMVSKGVDILDREKKPVVKTISFPTDCLNGVGSAAVEVYFSYINTPEESYPVDVVICIDMFDDEDNEFVIDFFRDADNNIDYDKTFMRKLSKDEFEEEVFRRILEGPRADRYTTKEIRDIIQEHHYLIDENYERYDSDSAYKLHENYYLENVIFVLEFFEL